MAHSLARSATLIVLIVAVAGLPGMPRQAAAGDGSWFLSQHALKEIPPNDVRFSDMGASDGNGAYDAFNPVVAYDSIRREYLVIWDGDDDTSPLVNGEFEIFGQRLRETGVEIDGDFRISHMGTDGDTNADARSPALVFNHVDDEFLAVWESDPNALYGSLVVNGEFEIFGRLLEGGTLAATGPEFRISSVGLNGSEDFDAINPALAFNSADGTYLVVWQGDPGPPLATNKTEIFGQLIAGVTGDEIGTDFRISFTGSDTDPSVEAANPAVVYAAVQNLFFVVWEADDTNTGLATDEYEIFGQFLDGTTGAPVGGQMRISDMGPDGTTAYRAANPSVACCTPENQLLVVWNGDDDEAGLVNDEVEIFGQLIDAATRSEVGVDLRISHAGPDGDTSVQALDPAVVFDSNQGEYLTVFEADDSLTGQANDEFEIFFQRVGIDGSLIESSVRISDMGPDSNPSYDAVDAAIAFHRQAGQFLVVWEGDDTTGDLGEGEFEIFGQRLGDILFVDGFESGDTSAWAATAP